MGATTGALDKPTRFRRNSDTHTQQVMPNAVPVFSAGQPEPLCQILAETSRGLTESEIARLLRQAGIRDIDPTMTKWKRLYNALSARQNSDRSGDRVFAFVRLALEPARYVGAHDVFEERRTAINAVLALCGFEYGADGKFHRLARAVTLSEAEQRAHRLRAGLSARGVHPDVIAYSRVELVQNNAFHAVLEASKSVFAKLRQRCGLQSDGAQLVDEALGGDNPQMRINPFITDSEKSEQRGLSNLVKRLFGVFRNPTAHAPRVEWEMKEEDALDLFSLASYVHRRIDAATVRPK